MASSQAAQILCISPYKDSLCVALNDSQYAYAYCIFADKAKFEQQITMYDVWKFDFEVQPPVEKKIYLKITDGIKISNGTQKIGTPKVLTSETAHDLLEFVLQHPPKRAKIATGNKY